MSIGTNADKCLHCGCCVGSCPQNAMFLRETALDINDDCNECGICVRLCPMGALTMEAD